MLVPEPPLEQVPAGRSRRGKSAAKRAQSRRGVTSSASELQSPPHGRTHWGCRMVAVELGRRQRYNHRAYASVTRIMLSSTTNALFGRLARICSSNSASDGVSPCARWKMPTSSITTT